MKKRINIFFDNCCSRKLCGKLRELYSSEYEEGGFVVEHLADYFAADTLDPVWLEKLAGTPRWLVISNDLGREKQHKLPILCVEAKITHILFTPGIVHRGYLAIEKALIAVWRQIERAPALPLGTRIKVALRNRKGGEEYSTLTISGRSFDSVCAEYEGFEGSEVS